MPEVSVIIPAYNAAAFLSATVRSVLGQTFRDLEIIIVDDGSTDATSDIVAGYGPVVRYYYQDNSGGCAVPRNTGIKHSSADFICFMDADDLMVPDRLARQVDFLKRHPHVGLVFCDYRNFSESGPYLESHFQTCPRLWPQLHNKSDLVLENACALLAQENFGSAGSLLIRKKVLELEAGFEPTLKACEDFHFYFRLARHTRVGVINEVGMMRRLHGNNMSSNSLKMLSERIRSRTMLRDSEQDPTTRSYLNLYIADCRASLSRYYADNGQYVKAVQNELLSLRWNFCWKRLLDSCKGIARTIMIAIGLHASKQNAT
jgi:glycosyltransferase involved in cell wall biosynthesis